MAGVLEHIISKKRLKELGFFSLEKAKGGSNYSFLTPERGL